MREILSVKNLTKRYGGVTACNDISFVLNKGEKAVVLGINGAGKSTLIKCIVNLLSYEGVVTYNGANISSISARKKVGYAPELPHCYNYLTVEEHLQFIAKAYKIENWREGAKVLLSRFNMYDKKDKLGKQLSKGMIQKINICNALIIDPELLILDEPLVGLDPPAIEALFSILEEVAKNTVTIFSTHIISTIENYWDTALILNEGNLLSVTKKAEQTMSLHDIFIKYHDGK